MPVSSRIGLSVLAGFLSFSIPLAHTWGAQNQPGRSATAGAVELSGDLFRVDSAGMHLYLPAGAIAQTTRAGDNTSIQILPSGPNPTWLVNLNTPQSSNPEQTPLTIAEEVLNQLLASVGVMDRKVGRDGILQERLVSTRGEVIQPARALELAGADLRERRPAARFYVRLPRGQGAAAVVRGYTIFQVAPGRFVTFDLVTTAPEFAASRRFYETMVGTVRFQDTLAAATNRGEAITAASELLARLSPSDYEAAMAKLQDQWYRLARQPAGTSDGEAHEIAYRRVRAWKGRRGELDTRRPQSKWAAGDRQEGYLVRIDARFLQDGRIVDSVGVYFMSPDRREEAWSLQVAIRDPSRSNPATWMETGARSGSSMSITVTGSAQENLGATPHIPDQAYITQVEGFLLPYLLMQVEAPGDYGFYIYQSETNNVRLRRDELIRRPASGPRGEAWTLTTRHNEDREPQTSIYNEAGQLLHTSLPDATLWTPTTLRRLADLWRSKGLPME
jgi:hypothetical protein